MCRQTSSKTIRLKRSGDKDRGDLSFDSSPANSRSTDPGSIYNNDRAREHAVQVSAGGRTRPLIERGASMSALA